MDPDSVVQRPPSASGDAPTSPHADPGEQREQYRLEMLRAAEEEAAAVAENARRDITDAVRRAHRELLKVRAQFHVAGLDPTELPSVASHTRGLHPVGTPSSLVEGIPRDAILVGRTHVLQDVLTHAASEFATLTSAAISGRWVDEQPRRKTRRSVTRIVTGPLAAAARLLARLFSVR
jgi:hypothetical protein